jgi:hypothetical protein
VPADAATAPADPDATQAHDVEALFETAADHDDERVTDLAQGTGAAPAPIEPVWADDVTTAIPAVAPPPEDAAPTTWVPPVAPTASLPTTPPVPPAELADADEPPGGMSGAKIALIVGLVVLVG